MMFLSDEIHGWMNDSHFKAIIIMTYYNKDATVIFCHIMPMWLSGVIVVTLESCTVPFHHSSWWWESASSHEGMLSISHSSDDSLWKQKRKELFFFLAKKNRYDWLMFFLKVWRSSFDTWCQKEQNGTFQQAVHVLIGLDYIIRNGEVNNLSS